MGESLDDEAVQQGLLATVASGDAVLFFGAGFACDARDLDGNPLPSSQTMACELWSICFGDCPPDDSTLADLYDVAMQCAPDQLGAYLRRRLAVGTASLPGYYATWFRAPWRRIYTLNVDDLEAAVSRQFGMPQPEVVHLNGRVGDPVDALTFSTFQYAQRLAGRDADYEQLAEDLLSARFVFVGTTLDEAVMWKHLVKQGLEVARAHGARPPSFLIAPSLARARRHLLASLSIRWIAGTAEAAAAALRGS